jgi:hypothetical protein
VGVRVRRDSEVALSDEFSDSRPRHTAKVEKTDPPVPEVVRRERRNSGGSTRFRGVVRRDEI